MWTAIFSKYVTDHVAFVVHAYLLSGDVLETIAVGAGILWESVFDLREIAHKLVIWGVVAETLCSVAMFSFDEGISASQQQTIELQQSKIIALETRLAPRILSADAQREIVGKIRGISNVSFAVAINPASETISLALQLGGTLRNVWTWVDFHPVAGISTSFDNSPAMFENQGVRGLLIAVPDEGGENLKLEIAASILRDAIRSATGFAVIDKVRLRLAPMQDTLGIMVGTKE